MTVPLTGLQKAAIAFARLPERQRLDVVRSLPESVILRLTSEVVNPTGMYDSAMVADVLDEAATEVQNRAWVGMNRDAARDVLVQAFGEDKADEILSQIQDQVAERPLAFLGRAEPRQIAAVLQDEHPQTIALVLLQMERSRAAQVLTTMDAETKADVARRLATSERISKEVLAGLDARLAPRFSNITKAITIITSSDESGVQPLVEILNKSERTTEKEILEGLSISDPELAEEVRRRLFLFEDIVRLTDRDVQTVLKSIDTKVLATALYKQRPEVFDKIAQNMSEKGRDVLREEVEVLAGRIQRKQVEEAQKKIVDTIRQLEEAEEIVVVRGDEEMF